MTRMAERRILPEQPTGIGRLVPGTGSIVDGVKHSAGLDLRAVSDSLKP